jgi:type IV pilus assembly protein PilV
VQTLPQNSRGFTLIEVVVAMLITLVGLMGLLQSVNIATEYNLKNELRDEAVMIGEEQLKTLMVMPFDAVKMHNFSASVKVPTRLRGADKKYIVTRSADVVGDSAEITVRVGWSYKNISSHHSVQTIRSGS